MKGYELYSWRPNGEQDWMYTLVTSTNRAKTWDEISTPDSTITEDGWLKITVQGEDALKSVLDRFPEGEAIFWWGPRKV